MQTLAQIQAQLANASKAQAQTDANKRRQLELGRPNTYAPSSVNGFTVGVSPFASQDVARQNGFDNSLYNQSNEAAANQYGITAQDPTRNPGAAMDRILGVGEDVYQNAANNPVDQMLMGELSKRVSGQNVPYDATTINALKTGAAEQSAAGEMANNQSAMASLESRGFTAKDPAYQAALAANQTQRQGQNQAANLSIAQQANLANYNAQGQAIGQANAVNRGAQGQQLAAGQFATQGLNQVSSQDAGRAPAWQQLPTWQGYQQAQQKQQKPATQSF